jgi:hypothetical protein
MSLDPDEALSIQPAKIFGRPHATWSLTTLKLPEATSFRSWAYNDPNSDDTATDAHEQSQAAQKDADAGLGRVRMAMIRMGCNVNLDAANTVSFGIFSLLSTADRVGVCHWSIDLLRARARRRWGEEHAGSHQCPDHVPVRQTSLVPTTALT